MKDLIQMNKTQRIAYIVKLTSLVEGKQITADYKFKNTTIEKLCDTDGGPYQRIKKWLESKVPKEESVVSLDMLKARDQFHNCFELMKSRNAKYGSSWRQLRNSSIVDLMFMKLDRCQKQELDDKAIEVEIEDIVNYGIFLLVNLRNK